MIESVEKSQPNPTKKKVSFMGYVELHELQPPTSYVETLANLFKGNLGTGCFAMADAIRNAGLVLGPTLLTIIAIICIQCFKMLINGADYIMKANELTSRPEFAEVVELSFLVNKSDNAKWKKCAAIAKTICNVAICITQLGFCCVYLIFVSSSIKLILEHYEIYVKLSVLMTIVLIPVWLSILERKLKKIAILSGLANVCMILGVFFTVGYSLIDLPSFSDRKYVNFESLPLFFGTAIFAFEGIALILPLQNAMKEPTKFVGLLGVMNVGMVLVSIIYLFVGFFGYWKYGEATAASLTLNLPVDQILAQVIIVMVATGVMFGYPIQFFVAIQIMFPPITEKKEYARKNPVTAELIFRSFICLVTFAVAQLIPNLSILLSLIGAVFCSMLVFIFPALIELTTRKAQYDKIGLKYWIKNSIIILMSLIGMILGGGQALYEIYLGFFKDSN
ncbi:proton-coupled amino acid transporter-like protein CG1139 [Chironomus tepperi]|uniref:proton-coupled amino acid transporter-like protein CG1139 n=1 Tax=Chironomus tepperi TaxID=113505 RepID=UPI00391F1C9C